MDRNVASVVAATPEQVQGVTNVSRPEAMMAVDQAMKRGFAFLRTHEVYLRPDGNLNVYRRFRYVR